MSDNSRVVAQPSAERPHTILCTGDGAVHELGPDYETVSRTLHLGVNDPAAAAPLVVTPSAAALAAASTPTERE